MTTKRIILNELRGLVKQIIKEDIEGQLRTSFPKFNKNLNLYECSAEIYGHDDKVIPFLTAYGRTEEEALVLFKKLINPFKHGVKIVVGKKQLPYDKPNYGGERFTPYEP